MKLIVNTRERKEALGDMFGIFFEDLNHAADGGLYAELVQNRSFEFDPVDNKAYHSLYAWERVEEEKVSWSIETAEPFCEKNPHYLTLHVRTRGKEAGIKNLGFSKGMYLEEGENYLFTCYVKVLDGKAHELTVSLRGIPEKITDSGKQALETLGQVRLMASCGEWTKLEAVIKADKTSTQGQLFLTVEEDASLALDFISLFPEHTFKNRRNGMRRDIAQLLADMHPKFMRFPGGCLVHDGSLNAEDRNSMYRWKNTIGPVEMRPARRNNWQYNQTLGLGFYEYFQFCEDIGAKPLPVVPGAYDPHHQRIVPIEELQPWIDDCLDLIEFANGSPDSRWGRVRAQMGHPEPFGLEYLAVGNEEVGDAFFERYPYFHRAIKERYPEIKVINSASPFAAGTEYERGWRNARENHSDLIDEHYYMAPEWMIANHHRYDSFSENDPKVFLGEYASCGNTWYNALVESSYMMGLERNAKAVGLACYAPMLAHTDYVNWQPDMVWFDNHRVYGSANYYVQKLFMNHQGSRRLSVRTQDFEMPKPEKEDFTGGISVKGVESTTSFTDIVVRNLKTGQELAFGDRLCENGEEIRLTDGLDWNDYSICCKATELAGFKGFQIGFGHKDEDNFFFALFGGWQNMDAAVHKRVNGRGCDLTEGWFQVERNRTYDLTVRVLDGFVTVFVDGEELLHIESKAAVVEPLYYAASVDETDGSVIVKVANLKEEAAEASVVLEGLEKSVLEGTVYTMRADLEAANSFEEPCRVAPAADSVTVEDGAFAYSFPAHSLTIFRLR